MYKKCTINEKTLHIPFGYFHFKWKIKYIHHILIRVVQGNFNLGWPKIISCYITTTVTTALLLLHKMLECFIFSVFHFCFRSITHFWRKIGIETIWETRYFLEYEDESKTFFVGIRHSLCPNSKISSLIQFNNMEHHIRNMVRCTNKEDRERKLPRPKVNTSNFTGVSFIFLWDVSWLLY